MTTRSNGRLGRWHWTWSAGRRARQFGVGVDVGWGPGVDGSVHVGPWYVGGELWRRPKGAS